MLRQHVIVDGSNLFSVNLEEVTPTVITGNIDLNDKKAHSAEYMILKEANIPIDIGVTFKPLSSRRGDDDEDDDWVYKPASSSNSSNETAPPRDSADTGDNIFGTVMLLLTISLAAAFGVLKMRLFDDEDNK